MSRDAVAKRLLQLLSFIIVPTIFFAAAFKDMSSVVGVSLMVEVLLLAVLNDVIRQEKQDAHYKKLGRQHNHKQ